MMTTHRGMRDPLTKFNQVTRRESKRFNTEHDELMAESYCTNPFPYKVQVFLKRANKIVDVEDEAETGEITNDNRGRGCLDKKDVVSEQK